MKKSLLWIAVLLINISMIAAFSLTGCKTTTAAETTVAVTASGETASGETTTTANTEKTTGEKTVIKFWYDEGDERYLNYFKAYMDTHPDIDVQVTVFERQDYKTQSRLALTSGDKPDIWTTNTGSFLTQFIDGGGAMDITDIAKERNWETRFTESSWQVGIRDGRVYAAPFGGIYPWQCLFANKKFFEDNKIPYPKTVDEMIAIVPQIEAAGMQPIAWGNKDGWPGQIWLGDIMGQIANPDIVDKLNSGEVTWDNSSELLTALQTLAKLAKGGAFVSGYAVQDHQAAVQSWLAEKSAMLYNGTWFYADVVKLGGVKFDVETIALPLVSADTSLKFVQLYPDPCVFIDKDTKVPEAAIDFFDYLISPEFYKILGEVYATLTPSPEANKEVNLPDWLKSEVLTKQFDMPYTNYWTTNFPMPVEETIANNIKQVLDGSIAPEQALKNIEQEHQKNR